MDMLYCTSNLHVWRQQLVQCILVFCHHRFLSHRSDESESFFLFLSESESESESESFFVFILYSATSVLVVFNCSIDRGLQAPLIITFLSIQIFPSSYQLHNSFSSTIVCQITQQYMKPFKKVPITQTRTGMLQ